MYVLKSVLICSNKSHMRKRLPFYSFAALDPFQHNSHILHTPNLLSWHSYASAPIEDLHPGKIKCPRYKVADNFLLRQLPRRFLKEFANKKSEAQPDLKAAFKEFLNYIKEMSRLELLECFERESILNKLGRRALDGLRIDPNYYKDLDKLDMEIRLIKPECMMSKESVLFKAGKGVEIIQGQVGKHVEPWKKVQGTVSNVTDNYIFVRIRSLGNFISDTMISKNHTSTISLAKSSEAYFLKNEISHMDHFSKTLNQSDLLEPFSNILTRIYDLNTHSTHDQNRSLDVKILNPKLNECQVKALHHCAQQRPVTVIHGPPGTGKTMTLAACIISFLYANQKVLVVTPSNAACDAITLAIQEHWPGANRKCIESVYSHHDSDEDSQPLGAANEGNLLRLANEMRVTTSAVRPLLPQYVRKHETGKMRTLGENLKQTRLELLNDSRGKKIGDLLRTEESLLEQLSSEIKLLQRKVIEGAKVVITTNGRAFNKPIMNMLRNGHFDLLCIDEAGFSLDAQTIPLISNAQRLILSGDHLQLPPVIHSNRVKKNGGQTSLLERVVELIPECVNFLSVQHRSNELISNWSSSYFYKGKLTASRSNKHQVLADLPGVKNTVETRVPLLFIDTADMNCREEADPDNNYYSVEMESICNYDEAFLVEQLIHKYLSLGVEPNQIGVITPYSAQVVIIKSLMWTNLETRKVEVNTVDGFQGRDKELVVVSFVRSNTNREVGFLEEIRRINVSVTRAKRCCIMIGDSNTLTSNSGLKSLISHCRKNKAFIPASKVL